MALKPHSISWDVYNPNLCGSRVTHTWSSWCCTAGGPAPQCNTMVFACFFSYISSGISLLSAVSSFSREWLRTEGTWPGATALCVGKAEGHCPFFGVFLERCRTFSALLLTAVGTLTWTWSGVGHLALRLASTRSSRWTLEKIPEIRSGGRKLHQWLKCRCGVVKPEPKLKHRFLNAWPNRINKT